MQEILRRLANYTENVFSWDPVDDSVSLALNITAMIEFVDENLLGV